ncbi:hypothetical protein D8798_01890 [Streptococcus cristatus]|uniref:Uncharacterized protein n=1 Tax=Streptococcus cristatus TaxID=45634 RepID=A0A3R9SNI4_STRCR|nr:hypothetical protein D8798_01890 [Streptococcus cristatus]
MSFIAQDFDKLNIITVLEGRTQAIIRNHYAKIVLDHFHPSLLYFLTKARCWDKSLTLNIKSVQN